jgi:arylsulfatase A-like enzyme
VIVVSDHGERLGEHYDPASPYALMAHGVTLYDPVLHVPCIIRPPGGLEAPRRVSQAVSLIDMFATILDVTGVEYDSDALDSHSLVPLFDGAQDDRFARQRTTAALVHFSDNRHTKLAVHDGPWKYIVQARSTTPEIERSPNNPISIHRDHMQRNAAPELLLLELARRAMDEQSTDVPLAFEYMLFNLDDDPGELNNVAAAEPEKTREMHALLTDELRRMHENADASTGDGAYLELSPEGEEALRALGYIE